MWIYFAVLCNFYFWLYNEILIDIEKASEKMGKI